MGKIYVDTTPLIYFLDDEKPFSDKVAQFFANHQDENDLYFTSTITDAEYLTFPYRMNDAEKIAQYELFLHDFDFHIVEPTRAISKQAASVSGTTLPTATASFCRRAHGADSPVQARAGGRRGGGACPCAADS